MQAASLQSLHSEQGFSVNWAENLTPPQDTWLIVAWPHREQGAKAPHSPCAISGSEGKEKWNKGVNNMWPSAVRHLRHTKLISRQEEIRNWWWKNRKSESNWEQLEEDREVTFWEEPEESHYGEREQGVGFIKEEKRKTGKKQSHNHWIKSPEKGDVLSASWGLSEVTSFTPKAWEVRYHDTSLEKRAWCLKGQVSCRMITEPGRCRTEIFFLSPLDLWICVICIYKI